MLSLLVFFKSYKIVAVLCEPFCCVFSGTHLRRDSKSGILDQIRIDDLAFTTDCGFDFHPLAIA